MRIALILLNFVIFAFPILAGEYELNTKTEKRDDDVLTTYTYTRKGEKILCVRRTEKPNGGKVIFQHVYLNKNVAWEMIDIHTGSEVDGFHFSVNAGTNCDVVTHFTPDGKLKDVALMSKETGIIDAFEIKEGILCPVEHSKIDKTNKRGQDIKIIFDKVYDKKIKQDEFSQDIEKLIDKYKEEKNK
jgi:hypothetical protein